jgi:hypothetical protein
MTHQIDPKPLGRIGPKQLGHTELPSTTALVELGGDKVQDKVLRCEGVTGWCGGCAQQTTDAVAMMPRKRTQQAPHVKRITTRGPSVGQDLQTPHQPSSELGHHHKSHIGRAMPTVCEWRDAVSKCSSINVQRGKYHKEQQVHQAVEEKQCVDAGREEGHFKWRHGGCEQQGQHHHPVPALEERVLVTRAVHTSTGTPWKPQASNERCVCARRRGGGARGPINN